MNKWFILTQSFRAEASAACKCVHYIHDIIQLCQRDIHSKYLLFCHSRAEIVTLQCLTTLQRGSLQRHSSKLIFLWPEMPPSETSRRSGVDAVVAWADWLTCRQVHEVQTPRSNSDSCFLFYFPATIHFSGDFTKKKKYQIPLKSNWVQKKNTLTKRTQLGSSL